MRSADTSDPKHDGTLEFVLLRSEELQERLLELLSEADFDDCPRSLACYSMGSVAIEHAASLRYLMTLTLPNSAAGLLRLQFEALTRAMWLLYAASDASVEKLAAPLSPESERAAKNLPSAREMIDDIGRCVPECAPAAAHLMLVRFKDMSWHAMNSFVHGGIHPLRRHAEGFPVDLATTIVRNSNGLLTMTGMALAVLTGDQRITESMSRIQPEFADCLPDLLK